MSELCATWTKGREKGEVKFDLDKMKPVKKWSINNLQSEQRQGELQGPRGEFGEHAEDLETDIWYFCTTYPRGLFQVLVFFSLFQSRKKTAYKNKWQMLAEK